MYARSDNPAPHAAKPPLINTKTPNRYYAKRGKHQNNALKTSSQQQGSIVIVHVIKTI